MRSALAYILALLAGLGVLSMMATPLLGILGLAPVSLSVLVFTIGFGMMASIVPYIAARLILRRWGDGGLYRQIVAGSVVAALSVLILNVGLSGSLTPFLFNARSILGVVLAGAVAGFIHHSILPAERKTT